MTLNKHKSTVNRGSVYSNFRGCCWS